MVGKLLICFIIGAIIGGALGIFVAALCQIASDDDYELYEEQEVKKK